MSRLFNPKSEDNKNLLTLITGTTLAQAIPIAVTPILTRIYTPEDFGVYALFISIVGIISSFSTGRYEVAMMLPKKTGEAFNLLVLSIFISLTISIITLVIILFFKNSIGFYLKNEEIINWLYLLPISIFLTNVYQVIYYWNNRLKKYKELSNSKIILSTSNVATNLAFGVLAKGPFGLFAGNVLGNLIAGFYLFFKNIKSIANRNLNFFNIKATAIRYKKFPKFDAVAALLNMSAHQSINIYLNLFFGAVSAGYYFLVQKIFGLPLLLIATSIQDVFKEKMSATYKAKGNTQKVFLDTFKKLCMLSIAPTIFIYFFSIDFIVFFFGENWEQAGIYVQILTPVFIFRFISFPLSFMFYITENMQLDLVGQFILLVLISVCAFMGKEYGELFTMKMISIIMSIYYLIYLYISYKFASKPISLKVEEI